MIEIFPLVFAGGVSLAISLVSIWLILRLAGYSTLKNRNPELHHTHQTTTPRFGGAGLAFAFVAVSIAFWFGGFSVTQPLECRRLAIPVLAMFALGFGDDLWHLGARFKLIGQILVASLAFFLGISISDVSVPFGSGSLHLAPWAAWLVTVLWLVATTNLINLIDGVDGLAGGISLMLMVLLAYLGGGGYVSVFAASMVGALLGFLWFNFPPARIYLGDGGAYFMGFLIGCLTIISSRKGTVFAALIAPLFVLALPILDTSLAILRRGLQGLPLFRPDRLHLHHRLLNAGVSRRDLVVGAYVFTAFFLFLGFAAFWHQGEHLPLVIGVAILFILLAAGKLSFSREWFAVGRVLGNSLSMRADIQYALAQNQWLILEGARCSDLDGLSEDAAFIARKLGFDRLRIRLGDQEKKWQLTGEPAGENDWSVCQHLPGHAECEIEVTARATTAAEQDSPDHSGIANKKTFKILSELFAEGWVKAVVRWERQHALPPRFSGGKNASPPPAKA